MNTTDEKPRSQQDDLAGDDATSIGWLLHEMYDLWEARAIYQAIHPSAQGAIGIIND